MDDSNNVPHSSISFNLGLSYKEMMNLCPACRFKLENEFIEYYTLWDEHLAQTTSVSQ